MLNYFLRFGLYFSSVQVMKSAFCSKLYVAEDFLITKRMFLTPLALAISLVV